jgi:hypothetical protein
MLRLQSDLKEMFQYNLNLNSELANRQSKFLFGVDLK